MIDLVLSSSDFDRLSNALLGTSDEACAILYSNQTTGKNGSTRILVTEMAFASAEDYHQQGPIKAELSPSFVSRVTKYARSRGYAVTYAHSHPGISPPVFSPTDDEGETHLRTFMCKRHPNLCHTALVLSRGGVNARVLGEQTGVKVITIGKARRVAYDPAATHSDYAPAFDRQVRAFGKIGQEVLGSLRAAIVGLGGTGSIVAQQLAHLGVQDFLLIDPDHVEVTNLNRLVGASAGDIGKPKVEIASRTIRSLVESPAISTVCGDIVYEHIAQQLQEVDIILGCTDSHGSRAVMQQISYQYLIPVIDMGSIILARNGLVAGIHGRVQMLSPGLACFSCSGLLDAEEVRRDMMTGYERKLDPYIVGDREPAPAVISLNGTVASLAVTMLLAAIVGIPGDARHLIYSAVTSSLKSVWVAPQPDCYLCSKSGLLAVGDREPLHARRDGNANP